MSRARQIDGSPFSRKYPSCSVSAIFFSLVAGLAFLDADERPLVAEPAPLAAASQPLAQPTPAAVPVEWRTVAETSDYQATTRWREVWQFADTLAQRTPRIHLTTCGTSVGGKALPMLILADPPVQTPAAIQDRLPVVLIGCIHAGEVCGKEALLQLARNLTLLESHPILKELVLVIIPVLNADANDRIDPDNRPRQVGPKLGMGERHNLQGLDLNRDFIKLTSPEIQALVHVLDEWKPALFIDTHTTNGSYHRHTMTYDGIRHAATHPKLVDWTHQQLLPAASRFLHATTGFTANYYGNFSSDRQAWETYPGLPHYSIQYAGLRQRVGVLTEGYAYAPYKDRVIATYAFLVGCLQHLADHAAEVRPLLAEAAQPPRTLPLRQTPIVSGTIQLAGYEEIPGKFQPPTVPKVYELPYYGGNRATLTVELPAAYFIPAERSDVVAKLQQHGIACELLCEDRMLPIAVAAVEELTKVPRPYRESSRLQATVRWDQVVRMVPAGTVVVRPTGALAALVGYLLEPEAEEGLLAWGSILPKRHVEGNTNQNDTNLWSTVAPPVGMATSTPGQGEHWEYPIWRLPVDTRLWTVRLPKPLPQSTEPTEPRPLTWDDVYGPNPIDLNGTPRQILDWFDDDRFLELRDGQLWLTHAILGASTRYEESEKMEQATKQLEMLPDTKRQEVLRGRRHRAPNGKFSVYNYEKDLYLITHDGMSALRLTATPALEELVDFSPNSHWLSFVRDNDLFVIRLSDGTSNQEYRVTTDGSKTIINGKADWVYFEELYNRNDKAHWWSPDSRYLAFLRFDDSAIEEFTVVNHIPLYQELEATRYPKVGTPNPTVQVKVAYVEAVQPKPMANPTTSSDSNAPEAEQTSAHSPESIIPCGTVQYQAETGESELLYPRLSWLPNQATFFLYVQNRLQTWLDICRVEVLNYDIKSTSAPQLPAKKLLRETTPAWVNDPGPPVVLPDRTFIIKSDRSGWSHLYRFSETGNLLQPLTSGSWDVEEIQKVDESNRWVYFTARHHGMWNQQLYRVDWEGKQLEPVRAPGKAGALSETGLHTIQMSPGGKTFLDTFTEINTPAQIALYSIDGELLRRLDTHPVFTLATVERSPVEHLQIPNRDGFLMEATLSLPPDYDPKQNKYPLWLQIYGGPALPIVRNRYRSTAADQLLLNRGVILLRVDPRSASGKGSQSAWTAYKQLGVNELLDLEDAVAWMAAHYAVDLERVGLQGFSYGGYLTAYALTHSSKFCGGIAGAPVTDWTLYDTIYTERYMGLPEENLDGYRKSSVVAAAAQLQGKLLLIHGLLDDNVHPQNSFRLIQALQQANKQFEVMFYPQARHGIGGQHLNSLQFQFIERLLKLESNRLQN